MLVAWKYRDRNTIIQRLDPRARMIFFVCVLIATMQLWDARWVLVMLALAVGQYVLARLSWRESRRFWLVISLLAVFLSVLTVLTSGRLTGYADTARPLFVGAPFQFLFWTVTPTITVEQVSFLVTQVLRIVTFALIAIVIPYTMKPTHYGVTFRGLGVPDKFAYAMDLSFRLVPTMIREFNLILDAQRARGYEIDRLRGGLIAKVRRLTPLLVPFVIGAIVGGEDITDAMDLRAFGVGPRTWTPGLTYRPLDKGLIVFSVGLLIVVTAATILGYGRLWIPEFLLQLAGG